jgi:hypothetical protein
LGVAGGGKVGGTQFNETSCFAKALEGGLEDDEHCAHALYKLAAGGSGTDWQEKCNKHDCYIMSLELDEYNADACFNVGVGGGGIISGKQYDTKSCLGRALGLDHTLANVWRELGSYGGGFVRGRNLGIAYDVCLTFLVILGTTPRLYL